MTPKSGVCCNCGNASDNESPCHQRDDGQHCEHWWDGPDNTETAAQPSGEVQPCTGAEFVDAAQKAIGPRSDEEIREIIADLETR